MAETGLCSGEYLVEGLGPFELESSGLKGLGFRVDRASTRTLAQGRHGFQATSPNKTSQRVRFV